MESQSCMKGTIMRKFEIEQHRIFTSDLFSGTAFDDFLLKEATVVTYAAFQIDGQIRKDFFAAPSRCDQRKTSPIAVSDRSSFASGASFLPGKPCSSSGSF